MLRYVIRTAVLVAVPSIWMTVWAVARDAAGPFWIERDPEYSYLLDSLQVAMGRPAGTHLLVHPGATLQVWCAGVTRLVGWLRGAESLAHDVVRHPELYLTVQLTAMMGLYAIVLYLTGVAVRRATGSLCGAVAVQLAPLALLPLTLSARKLYCEPMVMVFSMALVCALFACLPKTSRRDVWGAVLACALICGSGMATKFIFAPLVLIPLVVVPGVWPRLAFLAATLAVVVAWTAPVLWPHYGEMLRMCWHNIIRPERYGTGAAGIGNLTVIMQRMRAMITDLAPYGQALAVAAIITVTGTVYAVYRSISLSRGGSGTLTLAWRALRLVWALLLAQVLLLFLVARRNTLLYYIPATQLYGATLVGCGHACVELAGVAGAARGWRGWLGAAVRTLIYGAACAVLVYSVVARRTVVRRELASLHKNRLALDAHLEEVAPHVKGASCLHMWSMTPVDALQFGNDNSNWRASRILREEYPQAIFFDPRRPAGHQYHHFGREVSEYELVERHTNLYYRTYWPYTLPRLPLTRVLSSAVESLYRVDVAVLATNLQQGTTGSR